MINKKKFQVQFQLPMHHQTSWKWNSDQIKPEALPQAYLPQKRREWEGLIFGVWKELILWALKILIFIKESTLISCLKQLSHLADPHSLASRAEVEEHKRAMGVRWGAGLPLRPGSTPGRPSSPPPPPPPWQPWWRRRRASPQATTPYLSPGQNISRQWTIEIRQV